MREEKYFCDICRKIADYKSKRIQVTFETEQTEGRAITPYLEIDNLDLCEHCYKRIVDGSRVWAEGAQGHNTYYFKDVDKSI